MSRYLVHRHCPMFIWLANYKAMFSTAYFQLRRAFRRLEIYDEDDVPDFDLRMFRVLTVVRNPYSRLLSLYFDKCVTHPAQSKQLLLQPSQAQTLEALQLVRGEKFRIAPASKDLDEQPTASRVCTENFRLLQSISFDEFVQVARIVVNREDVDPHFRPQHRFVYTDLGPRFDHLFRLEEIEDSWATICRLLDKEIELVRENTTSHGPVEDYYPASLRSLVHQLYLSDFQAFGYAY